MDDSAEVMVALLLYFDPRGLSTVGMPVDVEARMADADKRQSKPELSCDIYCTRRCYNV